MWRYEVFAGKLTWYFTGVYIIKYITFAVCSYLFFLRILVFKVISQPRKTGKQNFVATRSKGDFCLIGWFVTLVLRLFLSTRCRKSYSGYQSHAPSNDFFLFQNTFWWTSIKCIHDNNGERSYQNHYFNVNSQSIRVALSSLLDSWINGNWEVRLIKSLRAPFRSSRSRAMFWSCKFTK